MTANTLPSSTDYLHPSIVEKTLVHRGYKHAFSDIVAHQTALVVIDMTAGAVADDKNCKALIEPINRLADTLRQKGGHVAWVRPAPNSNLAHLRNLCGRSIAKTFQDDANPANPRSALCAQLDAKTDDIFSMKSGFSAFFPGKCDLDNQLSRRKIRHILVAGTVTNVCCESSVRDAVELGYRVTMVADGNAGHSHGLHEASLNTIYRIFGDVRASHELIELIKNPYG